MPSSPKQYWVHWVAWGYILVVAPLATTAFQVSPSERLTSLETWVSEWSGHQPGTTRKWWTFNQEEISTFSSSKTLEILEIEHYKLCIYICIVQSNKINIGTVFISPTNSSSELDQKLDVPSWATHFHSNKSPGFFCHRKKTHIIWKHIKHITIYYHNVYQILVEIPLVYLEESNLIYPLVN